MRCGDLPTVFRYWNKQQTHERGRRIGNIGCGCLPPLHSGAASAVECGQWASLAETSRREGLGAPSLRLAEGCHCWNEFHPQEEGAALPLSARLGKISAGDDDGSATRGGGRRRRGRGRPSFSELREPWVGLQVAFRCDVVLCFASSVQFTSRSSYQRAFHSLGWYGTEEKTAVD